MLPTLNMKMQPWDTLQSCGHAGGTEVAEMRALPHEWLTEQTFYPACFSEPGLLPQGRNRHCGH